MTKIKMTLIILVVLTIVLWLSTLTVSAEMVWAG
jgi:hypothetical protein